MTENELRNLSARMLAGENVRKEEAQHLAEICNAKGETRRTVAELATIEGLMALALEDRDRRDVFLRQVDEAVAELTCESFAQEVIRKLWLRRLWQRGLAVAAVVLVAACVAGLWTTKFNGHLASIQRLETVTWSSFANELQAGTELAVGSRIQIDRGLMEISLKEKGEMLVEGPADIEFLAADRALLRSGKIVLHVTEQGHGYRVDTPQGTLVDLGTQFGVTVNEAGVMETHVLEGKVEAIPKTGGTKMLLEKGNAVRFAGNDTESLAADPDMFYTALPPRHSNPPNFVHWSLDSSEGTTLPATVRGFPGVPTDLHLVAEEKGMHPARVSGPFGSALIFDGLGGYAESGFPGIGGANPRTVAFWVRAPKDLSVQNGYGIVSWGHFTGNGSVWQVSINPAEDEGEIGRIRVGTHGGWIVGTADLRDGQWHHVAVVMYGGERPDIGTHVLVYLDGELEQISKKTLREINTQIEGARHGVWLGRNIAYRDAASNTSDHRFFRGSVDEVFICDASLTQAEIRRLMTDNRPPGF